jgi:GTP cyclohydrolase III
MIPETMTNRLPVTVLSASGAGKAPAKRHPETVGFESRNANDKERDQHYGSEVQCGVSKECAEEPHRERNGCIC